jgi:hypothetical protein
MEGEAALVLTCREYDVAGNERAMMFLPTSVDIRNNIEYGVVATVQIGESRKSRRVEVEEGRVY